MTFFVHVGFVFCFLPAALFWLDLLGDMPVFVLGLFFLALPLLRAVCRIDLPHVGSGLRSRGQRVFLNGLPVVHAVVWVATLLAIPFFVHLDRGPLHTVLQVLSLFVAAALALPVAHELIHRGDGFAAFCGRILSAASGLFYFPEEHRVHHRVSGSGCDLDAPREDQSVYSYALATTINGVHEAWLWDQGQRIRKEAPLWRSALLWSASVPLALTLWYGYWLGLAGAALYAGTALFCIFGFRAITYIQHWGLRDVPQMFGRQEGYSWDSRCIWQSWVTLNIAFHEHHHMRPTLKYYELKSSPLSLVLPTTYPTMFLLSLVPALYRCLMRPHLDAWLRVRAVSMVPEQRRVGCLIPGR